MTGYGTAKAQSPHSSIDISLRSVNGRFLETRFHLPREYMSVESDLKKIAEKYFQRGTIDIFVSRRPKAGGSSAKVHINRTLAKEYIKAYKTLAQELKIQTHWHVETIARLPDVLKVEEMTEASGAEKKSLLSSFEKACEFCDQERQREGKGLKRDLEKLVDSLAAQISEVQTLREEANKNLQQRLESKIQSRMNGVELDPSRISQEVVMQIEKSDINEELSRLSEHLSNYKKVLNEKGSKGKKLDFYTQELLREVNTIGSKSSVSKLTQIVVEAKTLIERLREQVQNVE